MDIPHPVSSTSKKKKLLSFILIFKIISPFEANFNEFVIKLSKIYNSFYLSELINPLLKLIIELSILNLIFFILAIILTISSIS